MGRRSEAHVSRMCVDPDNRPPCTHELRALEVFDIVPAGHHGAGTGHPDAVLPAVKPEADEINAVCSALVARE